MALAEGAAPQLPMATVSSWHVFLMTSVMVSATGLGAVPLFFFGRLSPTWAGLANALACGVMIAASFDLIHEGEPYGPVLVLFGLSLGAAFVAYAQAKLRAHDDVQFATLRGGGARKTLLMVAIMTAHAFGEGAGVGVSFAGRRGWAGGAAVAAAIGVHNVPEGLAVATVLVAAGASPGAAARWAVATHAPQVLVAVPAFLFVDTFTALLPAAMGFAAGCMLWMAFAELLPDALEGASAERVATVATLSAAALEAFRMALAAVEGTGAGGVNGAWPSAHPGGDGDVFPRALMPAPGALQGAALLAAAALAALAGAAGPLAGAAALSGVTGSAALRGDVARVLGAAHGAGATLAAAALAAAVAAGCGRAAALGAVLGVGGAWGARVQLRRGVRGSALLPLHAKATDDAEDVPPPPSQELRSALFVAAVALAHAAAEGLAIGAGARSAAATGRPLLRALAPGVLPGALRGAVYAGSVYGIAHSMRAGFGACVAAALAQQVAVLAALAGPADWGHANGFIDRAHTLAAGALIGTCLMELWPRAARQSPSSAASGAATGVAVALAAVGGAAALSAVLGSGSLWGHHHHA